VDNPRAQWWLEGVERERAADPLDRPHADPMRRCELHDAGLALPQIALIAASFRASMGLRPNLLPCALARSSPAFTRSWIIARSNSAKTPIIWNKALPAGVVVSTPCWCRKRLTCPASAPLRRI
jgi:hypothetical protein